MVLRSLLAHGLDTLRGVQHRPRYSGNPFAYDVVEPLRAMVDDILFEYYVVRGDQSLEGWRKCFPRELTEHRWTFDGRQIKWLDAIDKYVCSIADYYRSKGDINRLWIPAI